MRRRATKSPQGSSILELVVTLGLLSIIMGIAAANLQILDDPLQDGASQLLSFVKKTRARAISTTSAFLIEPVSTNRIAARFAKNCHASTFTDDPKMALDIPTGARLIDTTWSVCFNPRGLADDNLNIYLTDGDTRSKNIEIFLGGAARIEG